MIFAQLLKTKIIFYHILTIISDANYNCCSVIRYISAYCAYLDFVNFPPQNDLHFNITFGLF